MADDSRWDLLTLKLEHLHQDVGGMKSALKDLTEAVAKLALVEERQTNASQAMARAFAQLEKLEARVAELERAAPDAKRVTTWIYAAIGAVIVAGALAALGFKKG